MRGAKRNKSLSKEEGKTRISLNLTKRGGIIGRGVVPGRNKSNIFSATDKTQALGGATTEGKEDRTRSLS